MVFEIVSLAPNENDILLAGSLIIIRFLRKALFFSDLIYLPYYIYHKLGFLARVVLYRCLVKMPTFQS